MIGLGLWVGSVVAAQFQQRLKRFHSIYGTFSLDAIVVWAFIPGLLGARLYHVIDAWEYYAEVPMKMLAFWEGGLGIYGGILGGITGIALYSWVHPSKTSQPWVYLLSLLDCGAVGMPVAQAIGRFGNYFNQELFGLPTQLPWGIFIDPVKRPEAFWSFSHFHPLFLYESLANIGLLIWFWSQLKTSKPVGWWVITYLIGYSLIRFSLDFLRIDPWKIGWLTTAQWVSLGFIGLGMIALVRLKAIKRLASP